MSREEIRAFMSKINQMHSRNMYENDVVKMKASNNSGSVGKMKS